MNDDRSPIDDELLSAVLDGEATPEERALVEGSPEALERLGRLRAAAARVGEPVPALDVDVTARLLDRALDEAATATPAPVVPAIGATPSGPGPSTRPQPHDDLAGRRARRRTWVGALAGVAAALLLVVVGLSLARDGGRESADSSSATAAGGAADELSPAEDAATTAGGSTSATAPADLGSLPDTAAVLARFALLESAGADFDHQFDAPAAESGTENRGQAASDAPAPVPAPTITCAVPPVAARAGESWVVAATAQLPDAAVLVMVDRAGGAGARVLVIDATTCAVRAEGTL